MKRLVFFVGLIISALFFSSAISIREIPQDPPRGKKAQKNVKVMVVDKDGKKTKLDTTIKADDIMVWTDEALGKLDLKDLLKDIDVDVDVEKEMESLKDVLSTIRIDEQLVEGDSLKEIKVKVFVSEDGECHKLNDEFAFDMPDIHHEMMLIDELNANNVINLNDPGVVSFTRKDLKDGKEKIVIVREKPSKKALKKRKEFFMKMPSKKAMKVHKHPHVSKNITVFTDDDGHITISEDGKTWTLEGGKGELEKIIEKDGKKIQIIKKKLKDSDEIELKVEVEDTEKDEDN